eukprot:m.51918 g.51918  ORF g.51918 m.51918 type:complete len:572 (+) comp12255_c1_seq2:118-1833(+)
MLSTDRQNSRGTDVDTTATDGKASHQRSRPPPTQRAANRHKATWTKKRPPVVLPRGVSSRTQLASTQLLPPQTLSSAQPHDITEYADVRPASDADLFKFLHSVHAPGDSDGEGSRRESEDQSLYDEVDAPSAAALHQWRQRSDSRLTRPPESRQHWFKATMDPDQGREILQNRSDGSFVVCATQDKDVFELLYTRTGIVVSCTIERSAGGLHLVHSTRFFASLEALVAFYAHDASGDLECSLLLRKSPVSTSKPLYNQQLGVTAESGSNHDLYTDMTVQPAESAAAHVADSMPWCQMCVPHEHARGKLAGKANGTFVIVTDATPHTEQTPWMEPRWRLMYAADGEVLEEVIAFGFCDRTMNVFLQQHADRIFPSVDALIRILADAAHTLLKYALVLPVVACTDGKVVHPSFAWCQLGIPKSHCLSDLKYAPNGAFVVRTSSSKPENLVLSFIKSKALFHEIICVNPSKQEFFLELFPDTVFPTLHALVSRLTADARLLGLALLWPGEWQAENAHGPVRNYSVSTTKYFVSPRSQQSPVPGHRSFSFATIFVQDQQRRNSASRRGSTASEQG